MEKTTARFIIILAILNFIAMLYVTNGLSEEIVNLETKLFKLQIEKYKEK